MDKTPAYYIFLGLLIGALFGLGTGMLNGNSVTGPQIGSLTGVFIGWIVVASSLKKSSTSVNLSFSELVKGDQE
jgi:hypothetical protein